MSKLYTEPVSDECKRSYFDIGLNLLSFAVAGFDINFKKSFDFVFTH